MHKKDIDFNAKTLLNNEQDNVDENQNRIQDDNVEVSDYYKRLRNKIIETYENGEKQKAIDLLWEELQQPYIPLSIEQDFYDLYNAYSLALREEALKINWDLISKNEIYDRILNKSTGSLDLYFVNLYLNYLLESNNLDPQSDNNIQLDAEDSKFIQFLLTHPYINNMEKYNLVIELKNAGVNQEFKYMNTNFAHAVEKTENNEFTINPKLTTLPEENEIIKKVAKVFEDNDSKTPDILNYEMELLFIMYVFVFPRQNIAKPENLINAISSYVHGIVDGTEYDRNDPIIQIIESELAKIDNLDNNPYAF